MAKSESIEFKTRIGQLAHLVGMHYLEVPAKIVRQLGGAFNVRLICTVNNILSYQCGLVALGNGKGYISINNARLKKYKLQTGDTVQVSLVKDESEFGMEVSEELTEVFAQDEAGFNRFKALTPGRQRYIIHYVSSVKNPQLRVERALLLIQNLKMLPEGKENFRDILGKKKD